ncbi:MAG: hypothetical protein DSY59_04955 [Persephonella sp.]|nr:MAG: hypothetical protein DSY60_01485 [Persephonella sp.]RUM59114.1 MAG: hypothetical protein DSY59_04955 [Persephonella sp.]
MKEINSKRSIAYLLEALTISIIIFGILYSSIPIIQKKVEQEIIKYSTKNVIDAIDNAITSILSSPSEDVLLKLIIEPKARKELRDKLIIFNTDRIKFILILYKDPIRDKIRYIMDVFEGGYDVGTPFTPYSLDSDKNEIDVVRKVSNDGIDTYLKHEDNNIIGITYYHAYVQKGIVKLVVAIDFSFETLKEIENMAFYIKWAILFVILFIGVIFLLVLYSIFRNFLLKQKAFTDSLTGVYNRNYLESIRDMINPKHYVVVMTDIDHFKKVNDSFGHERGDLVLREFAKTIAKNLRKNDLVFRYGGEEFLILLNTPKKNKEVVFNILDRIRKSVEDNVVDGIKVTASFGVFLETNKAKDLEDAIKKADSALYKAKEKGRNRIEFFKEDDDIPNLSIPDIIKIIENEDVVCYYQPVMNVKENKVLYYEALARLKYKGEILPPLPYISLIKGTRAYANFTKLIIKFNIKILKKYKDLKIGINLSSSDFLNEEILKILRDLDDEFVRRIYLEITDAEDIKNYEPFKKNIDGLIEKGYNLVLDDFGKGNTDFVLLTEMNVRYIKIDGLIVKNITRSPDYYNIFKHIATFSKEIGKEPIAEFIENEEILQKVIETGVKYGQGFYFGRPLPIERIYRINE